MTSYPLRLHREARTFSRPKALERARIMGDTEPGADPSEPLKKVESHRIDPLAA